jgi:hypothetical protein
LLRLGYDTDFPPFRQITESLPRGHASFKFHHPETPPGQFQTGFGGPMTLLIVAIQNVSLSSVAKFSYHTSYNDSSIDEHRINRSNTHFK